jgi:hypothetical protein
MDMAEVREPCQPRGCRATYLIAYERPHFLVPFRVLPIAYTVRVRETLRMWLQWRKSHGPCAGFSRVDTCKDRMHSRSRVRH